MILAGDEFGRSQAGNNNAYAQDNPTNWLDWEGADQDLIEFVARLSTLRNQSPILRQTAFLHGEIRGDGSRNLVWRMPSGAEPRPEDWDTRANWVTVAGKPARQHPTSDVDAVMTIASFVPRPARETGSPSSGLVGPHGHCRAHP